MDIPGGSSYYLYDNGRDIGGWSHGEFAALIGSVVDEIDWGEHDDPITRELIKGEFEDYFGGWDNDYRGGIAPPERGEIFCQCVDKRIDELHLSESLHQAVENWVDDEIQPD